MTSSAEPINELYANLTPQVREDLSQIACSITVPRGTKLVPCGAKPKQLVILNSGSAQITVPSEGKTLTLGTVGPGKVLGLRAIVAGEPFEVEVTALEDCKVTLLEGKGFLSVLHRNPQMYLIVIKLLSADLSNADRFLRQRAKTLERGDSTNLPRK
jgi:CRP-like cAMP-binding protein